MNKTDLIKIFQDIISESVRLKNKYTREATAKVEFADIFSKDDDEFWQLTDTLKTIGNIAYPTPTGDIYKLNLPIETVAGPLYFVKIRKPDIKLNFRGDADFNTDYKKLKQEFQSNPNFELIIREKFEMLRLKDSNFNVMACFSNIPVKEWVK